MVQSLFKNVRVEVNLFLLLVLSGIAEGGILDINGSSKFIIQLHQMQLVTSTDVDSSWEITCHLYFLHLLMFSAV